MNVAVRDECVGEAEDRVLVLFVRLEPRGLPLRFPHRLGQILIEAIGAQRVRTDEGLVQEVLEERVRAPGCGVALVPDEQPGIATRPPPR